MPTFGRAGAALAVCALASCSGPAEKAAPSEKAAPAAVHIVNFYATAPTVPRGDKEMLCYGVENARSVWLEPPRQELSAALSRCVEVEPKETTTYTLTAQDAAGGQAVQKLTVTVGAAKAKLLEVQVSSLEVGAGQPVSICWKAQSAAKVTVTPRESTQPAKPDCVVETPLKTTTYTVTAIGAGGDRDQEKVTVKVK
jgi:hypothetical protein